MPEESTCSCGCNIGACQCKKGCGCGCNHAKGGADWAAETLKAESFEADRGLGFTINPASIGKGLPTFWAFDVYNDQVNYQTCLTCTQPIDYEIDEDDDFSGVQCRSCESKYEYRDIDNGITDWEKVGYYLIKDAEEGYDFQKMTPSPFVPFDQIGTELQQQRMEGGPMLEPTNANFSAESENCPKCDSNNLGKEEMYYCYSCGNDNADRDECSKCGSANVGEEEMDYCYNCGGQGHWFDAESFEAECSICDTHVRTMSEVAWMDDDGECVCMDCMGFDEDFQGKPYTGKINPNDPDFDAVKADRNKDNKLSSWERAVGNQVARSMRRGNEDRMPMPRSRITEVRSTKKGLFGSIGPLVIVGFGVAYFAGKKYLKN